MKEFLNDYIGPILVGCFFILLMSGVAYFLEKREVRCREVNSPVIRVISVDSRIKKDDTIRVDQTLYIVTE